MSGITSLLVLVCAVTLGSGGPRAEPTLPPLSGDAIPQSLTGRPGDARRGAALLADRNRSLCVLCHSGMPGLPAHMQGDLAPSLAGIGARLSAGQLRLRIADMKRLNPESIMPAYHGARNARRIGETWRARPILSAEEIEDLVAHLSSPEG
jgi:sulfur-oxidizing protein SoxX